MPSTNLNIDFLSTSQSQKEVTLNVAIQSLDTAIAGRLVLDLTTGASRALSAAEALNAYLRAEGAPGADRTLVLPAKPRLYIIDNQLAGTHALLVKTATGAAYTVESGKASILYCDSVTVASVGGGGSSAALTALGVTVTALQAQAASLSAAEATDAGLIANIADQITTINATIASLTGRVGTSETAVAALQTAVATLQSTTAALLTAAAAHSTTADVNAARDVVTSAVTSATAPQATSAGLAAARDAVIAAMPSTAPLATTTSVNAARDAVTAAVTSAVSPLSTAYAVAAARVDILAAVAAITSTAGTGGTTAVSGDVKLCAGALPAGYTRITGDAPTWAAAAYAYTPGNSNASTAAGSFSSGTAVLAANGKIYDIAFNQSSGVLFSQFDPATAAWSQKAIPPQLSVSITPYSLCALPDGRLFRVNSYNSGMNNSCYTYNTTTDAWTQVATKPGAVGANASGALAPALVSLGDGRVFVHDGYTGPVGGCYLYNSGTNAWTTLPTSPIPSLAGSQITGALLPSGNVLLITASGVGYIYNPTSGAWSTPPAVPNATGFTALRAIPCAGGAFVIFNGKKHTYSESANAWVGLETMPISFQSTSLLGAAKLPDGSILIGMNDTFIRNMSGFVSKTPYYATKD